MSNSSRRFATRAAGPLGEVLGWRLGESETHAQHAVERGRG